MRSIIVFSVCAMLAAAATSAQDPAQQESRSKETVARVIELPTRVPGLVAFPKCETCLTRQYQVDARTELLIGEVPVSLARMREEIKLRPNAMAMVAITADRRGIQMIFISPPRPGE